MNDCEQRWPSRYFGRYAITARIVAVRGHDVGSQ